MSNNEEVVRHLNEAYQRAQSAMDEIAYMATVQTATQENVEETRKHLLAALGSVQHVECVLRGAEIPKQERPLTQ
jgi:hypothetical protein